MTLQYTMETMKYKQFYARKPTSLTLLHSEQPKLYGVLAFLSAIEFKKKHGIFTMGHPWQSTVI